MGTFILVCNALVYLYIFKRMYKKFDGFGPTSFVPLFYAFFAIMAIPLYSSGYYELIRHYSGERVNDPSVWPFLFILLFLGVFFLPIYLNPVEKVSCVEVPHPENEKLFLVLFFFVSVVSIILLLPNLSSLSATYDHSSVAEDFMDRCNGNSRFTPIQQKFLNWVIVLRTAGVPLFFYYLSYRSNKRILLLFLGIAAFVPTLLQSLINLSRGAMFYWLLDIFVGYVLFYRFMPESIKKKISLLTLIITPILAVPALIITFSRFGEGIAGLMSVVTYFGEPFLNFPLLFWGEYRGFSMGEYYFGPIVSYFWTVNAPVDKISRFRYFTQMTGTSVAWFRTIVGSLVMEFGYWGAFVFASLWSGFYSRFLRHRKDTMPFSRMIIYYYFYMVLIQGVWGFNTSYDLIYRVVIVWFAFGFDLRKKVLSI